MVTQMKTILVVLGTRPEAIKLAPVIIALKENNNFNVIVCNTEQQKELSNQTLGFFGIHADIKLDVMIHNQSLVELQSRLLTKLDQVLSENKIDATIVQGDTMTVFCAALTSFYKHIPVFHVEAGLRSYDLEEPFPEEAIRQMVSRLSSLHFCPTNHSIKSLEEENLINKKIFNTGYTVIDALKCISCDVMESAKNNIDKYGINLTQDIVLITAHRRENHGDRLNKILNSIKILSKRYKDTQFVIPVHPNPNVKNRVVNELSELSNIFLLPPLPYPELVLLMRFSKMIMTDSGGIQEEAPTFGHPILVLRYETERNEGVEAGFSELVGADEEKIIKSAMRILDSKETVINNRENPYGDGKAALRIVEHIEEFFNR